MLHTAQAVSAPGALIFFRCPVPTVYMIVYCHKVFTWTRSPQQSCLLAHCKLVLRAPSNCQEVETRHLAMSKWPDIACGARIESWVLITSAFTQIILEFCPFTACLKQHYILWAKLRPNELSFQCGSTTVEILFKLDVMKITMDQIHPQKKKQHSAAPY